MPAAAQERVDNEPLVLRRILDGCLGVLRTGRRPFSGLAPGPLRAEVEARLPAAAQALPGRHHLLSERNLVYQGEQGTDRLCVISATDDHARFPPLLTVPHAGYMDRASPRATEEGLTDFALPERFDMFRAPKWSEPGGDPSEVRIVAIPYEPTIDGVPLDMGIIIVEKGLDRPTS